MTYKIIRFYSNKEISSRTIKTGLSEIEAQEHCKDPNTSWKTCTSKVGKARTSKLGGWFDGYDQEQNG